MSDTDTSPSGSDETVYTRFSGSEPTSFRTIQALAAVTGDRLTELEPLHHAVDTDALDSLFREPVLKRNSLSVMFTTAGCEVSIESSGTISVTPIDE